MNLSNYYWYFKSALPPKFCDDVIKYGLQHQEDFAITGGLGVNRNLSRDCLGKDNSKDFNVSSEQIQYSSCNNLTTGQSRVTNPAWTYRDKEQVDWYYPPLNPQENTCVPFLNNLNTRILEKDYFTPKRDCIINEANDKLPTIMLKGNYVGGPNIPTQNNSAKVLSRQ